MRNDEFYDDGRQIADMSFTKVSWYGARMKIKKPKAKATSEKADEDFVFKQEPELTKKESRGVIFNAIIAALLIGFVFIGCGFIFIWFLVNVWL